MIAYQIKITEKNRKPVAWRRCQVPAGLTYTRLAEILLAVSSRIRLCLSDLSSIIKKYGFRRAGQVYLAQAQLIRWRMHRHPQMS